MALWQNLPLALILLPLLCAAVSAALKSRAAGGVMVGLTALECVGMGALCYFTLRENRSFVYTMGEIGAPFGNELRIGPAEALVGLLFAVILLLSVLGGWRRLKTDIAPNRMSLYAAVVCLLTAAMAAMVFTNDLFTAYVFIEISTISACALICARNDGTALFASARYMIMNLLGSGLFLLGLSMLYGLTGHLLFPQLAQAVRGLLASGRYPAPLYLSFLLMTMGIAVKSALYPFHTWLPSAYSSATATSSAILSSLISKMYIFLLMKLFFRAAGTEVFARRIEDVLFLYAMVGVVAGSIHALMQKRLLRMISYSSVAQIGYIFLGVALGTPAGMGAALFHILAHSLAKSMLFLSGSRLKEVAGGDDRFPALRGAGLKAPMAGLAFLVGACSLVGVPLLGGFCSKVYLAQAGVEIGGWRMVIVLADLLLSTVLNVGYFLRACMTLYSAPEKEEKASWPSMPDPLFAGAMGALLLLNFGLGVWGGQVLQWIEQGIALFA